MLNDQICKNALETASVSLKAYGDNMVKFSETINNSLSSLDDTTIRIFEEIIRGYADVLVYHADLIAESKKSN